MDPDLILEYPSSALKVIRSKGDGHCIIYSVLCCMRYLNIQAIPSKEELLNLLKFEVLNHLDYYGKFVNSLQVDCVQELDRYASRKTYSTDTNDLVISALSNLLKCRILLLTEGSKTYYLENSHSCITPQRDQSIPVFTIKLLRNKEHYDSLIDNVNVEEPESYCKDIENEGVLKGIYVINLLLYF